MGYVCSEPNDQTGEYYRAEEVEKVLEELRERLSTSVALGERAVELGREGLADAELLDLLDTHWLKLTPPGEDTAWRVEGVLGDDGLGADVIVEEVGFPLRDVLARVKKQAYAFDEVGFPLRDVLARVKKQAYAFDEVVTQTFEDNMKGMGLWSK